jgi:DNA mismatch repair protein MutL
VQKALALEAPEAERRTPAFKFDEPRPAPRIEKQHEFEQLAGVKCRVASGENPVTADAGRSAESPDYNPQSAILNRQSSPWKWCRVLGQAGGLYAVLETEEGVVLMDPQAAHERVLFEKFMHDLTAGKPSRQGLLTPEAIELMPADADALRRQLPVLDEMGFGISDFGQDTFIVDALPVHLQNGSPIVILSGIAQALEKSGAASKATREALRETVAQAACRTSVKAKDALSTAMIERLVEDLAKTEMPYTCPHGRPTLIFTSFTELNRKFGKS